MYADIYFSNWEHIPFPKNHDPHHGICSSSDAQSDDYIIFFFLCFLPCFHMSSCALSLCRPGWTVWTVCPRVWVSHRYWWVLSKLLSYWTSLTNLCRFGNNVRLSFLVWYNIWKFVCWRAVIHVLGEFVMCLYLEIMSRLNFLVSNAGVWLKLLPTTKATG